ncbi:MAG: TonB family protein [Pseudomonadota bacterium]
MFGWRPWIFGLLFSLAAHVLLASAFIAPQEETLVAGGAEVSVSVLGDAFADSVMSGEPSDTMAPVQDQSLIEEQVQDVLAPQTAEPLPIEPPIAETLQPPVPLQEMLQAEPPKAIETRSNPTPLAKVQPDEMAETSSDTVRMALADEAPALPNASPTTPLKASAPTAAASATLTPMEAARSVPTPLMPPSPSQVLALNAQPAPEALEPARSSPPLSEVEETFDVPERITIPTTRPQRKPAAAAKAVARQKPAVERKRAAPKKPAITRRTAKRRQETRRNAARARQAARTQKRRAAGNRGRAQRNARAGTSRGTARRAARNAGKASRNSRRAGNASISNYRGKLRSRIMRRFRPGRIRGVRRDVVVRFVMASNGRLRGASIARSSGNSRLDKAALRAVRSAAPFPAFPAGFGRSSLTVTVPMNVRR